MKQLKVTIVDFNEKYGQDFVQLNFEWLEKIFLYRRVR